MTPKGALLALAALPATQAFFLIPCWHLSTQRLDPIVFPGAVASHLHEIVGGSAFNPALDYNDTQTSDCTSCMVSKDKSNYWVPSMFYSNGGSYERVPQHGSASLYYLNEKTRLGSGETMEALPVGLRILAGDSDKRSGSSAFEDQAINYKCLDYSGTPTDHKGFPDKNCPNGVRAEITFPSCWDGVNLDSSDHKSHMAYPTVTYEAGACPATHPRHLVTVKMEVIFETFNYQWSGSNPFLWSTGDPTGFGFHGDLVMGWDYDLLARAVEECDNTSGRIEDCAPFAGLIPVTKQWLDPGTCRVDSFVNEEITSPMAALPGCNQIQAGPGKASKQSCGDTVSLKGSWSDYSGKVSDAVSSIGAKISSVVDGILPGAATPTTAGTGQSWVDANPGTTAAPSAAPHQFFNKDGSAPNVHTEWVYVTVTTTITGPEPAATKWTNAKRDVENHKHKHRHAHGRRSF